MLQDFRYAVRTLLRSPLFTASVVASLALALGAKPTVYYPQNLFPQPAISLLVRTESDPRALISPALSAIRSVDSEVFVFNVRTMDQILAASLAGRRFTATVLSVLGFIALGLSLLGLSSVVAQTIVSRAKEIGVRAALGARRTDIFRLIVGRAMSLVLIGLAVGLPLAYASLRLLAGLLFEGPQAEFVLLAVTPFLVLLAAGAACCVPARRLTRIDPLAALRSD
jgi:putative ABC transport system permease protein